MARLTSEEIISIHGISEDLRFKVFMGVVERMYSDACGECYTADDDLALRRAQGAAKRLEELIEFVTKSHENLKRLKDGQEASA